jgi:hypothetical protein
VAGFDNDSFNLALVELGHELTKNHIFFRFMVGHAEQVKEQNHEEADDDPEKYVLCPGIHPDLLVDGTLKMVRKAMNMSDVTTGTFILTTLQSTP